MEGDIVKTALAARRKVKHRKLTPKQLKYAEGRLAGLGPKDAAIAADYSLGSNMCNVSQLIKHQNINRWIREQLVMAGLTPGALAVALAEGIKANTVKYAIKDGEFKEERINPDHALRLEYIKYTTKLLGGEPPKTSVKDSSNNWNADDTEHGIPKDATVNVVVIPDMKEWTVEQIREFMQQRRQELTSN